MKDLKTWETDCLLIEQLRHACAVAIGDLIAHGMTPTSPTASLLLGAIQAAEDHQAQAGGSRERTGVSVSAKAVAEARSWLASTDPTDGHLMADYLARAIVEADEAEIKRLR